MKKRRVALPPGLQPLALTVEEAEKIREVLDDPKQKAHKGREMPTGNPSLIKKRRKPKQKAG